MLLWDYESEGWLDALDGMATDRRRSIALAAIKLSLQSFRPSFEALFSEDMVRVIRKVLDLLQSGNLDARDDGLSEDLFRELGSLIEEDPAPGAASLVLAVSHYLDCLSGDIGAEDVLEVMSGSYESLLNSERIGRVTPEAERQNSNCVKLIGMQRRLVMGGYSS